MIAVLEASPPQVTWLIAPVSPETMETPGRFARGNGAYCAGFIRDHLPLRLQRRAVGQHQALDPPAHAVPGLGHDDLMPARH
jgi:hypothetical protein